MRLEQWAVTTMASFSWEITWKTRPFKQQHADALFFGHIVCRIETEPGHGQGLTCQWCVAVFPVNCSPSFITYFRTDDPWLQKIIVADRKGAKRRENLRVYQPVSDFSLWGNSFAVFIAESAIGTKRWSREYAQDEVKMLLQGATVVRLAKHLSMENFVFPAVWFTCTGIALCYLVYLEEPSNVCFRRLVFNQ